MATIRDIAKEAGVSITTVSIIMNGKAEERKISQATQEKVAEAMKKLEYQPNLSARKLRSQESEKPVIAFFWPLDFRVGVMSSFLSAFQLELKRINFDCELVIQTYENDHLKDSVSSILRNRYHGIMIGACTPNDLAYLESLSPQLPVVVINRKSEIFSTVCTDNIEAGSMAADAMVKKGYKEAVVISSESSYVATGIRTQAFLYACSQSGINVHSDHMIKAPNTIQGGYEAGMIYGKLKNPPKVIFFDSDIMALGALSAFHKQNYRIPEDLELITISMLDTDQTEFSTPPLSVIAMPNLEVGKAAIDILYEQISKNDIVPQHITLHATPIMRDSLK